MVAKIDGCLDGKEDEAVQKLVATERRLRWLSTYGKLFRASPAAIWLAVRIKGRYWDASSSASIVSSERAIE